MLSAQTLADLMESIASGAPSPGSGSAAAAALALGIACLRKAVAISLRAAPDDPALRDAETRLCGLLDQVLAAADADARGFPMLLAAGANGGADARSSAADDLVALSARLLAMCDQVRAETDALSPLIKPNMANDLLAARALTDAAAAVVRANGEENGAAVEQTTP